ncbi:MAG: RsmB/NOP family class I SAM-dependent RNA methyltransferase [Hyphomicrobiales bacterium]
MSAGLDARRVAVDAVAAVLGKRIDLGRAFAPPASLTPADRGFAYSITTTTLRRLGEIDALLSRFLDKPLPARSGRARDLLRTATAQLACLGVAPYAAINTAVEIARADPGARHFAGLVNAVLRKVANAGGIGAEADPGIDTPAWLFDRWRVAYGDDRAAAIAAAHRSEPSLDITAKADADRLATVLGGERLWNGTIRIAETKGMIEALPEYADGTWWVQDQAAALPATLFRKAPVTALDVCAAPGGKTAQLAARGAAVTAIDRSLQRLDVLRENLARLKLEVTVVAADFLEWTGTEKFDAVLLDAPCTATGTVRRNPDIPWLRQPADVEKLAALQARLLDRAAQAVADGGTLVYCTCSLEPEEGERQIAPFLAAHPEFTLDPVTVADVAGHETLVTPEGFLRTLPCFGMDGFFAARLARKHR